MKKIELSLIAFVFCFSLYSQDAVLIYQQNSKPLLVSLTNINMVSHSDTIQTLEIIPNIWDINTFISDIDSLVFVEKEFCNVDYRTLTCPDKNHPHAIDLGLPSGTKWACCNVEASAPEEYGGYYAWGETETKSVYSPQTYQFYLRWDSVYQIPVYEYIGDDIAGTEYDVAYKKCGVTWRMPSRIQVEEIVDNCSSTRFSLNDVKGVLVNGVNEAKFFLPFCGYYIEPGIRSVEEQGRYWSSSHMLDSSMHSILFTGFSVASSLQYEGFSVRAVSQ
jgi:hypothetical protein